MITEEVRKYDKEIKSMYDDGGRETNRSTRSGRMSSEYHGYGQYLGWHSLLLVAGRLLQQYPVTDDWYYDDPWPEWLNRRILTRHDGLWLSDGMDRQPLGVQINLLEKGKDSLILTGSKTKLLSLIGIDKGLGKGIVVEGSWSSPDNIRVNISSALVTPRKAKALARQLIHEKPFFAWLPTYEEHEDDDEYVRNDKKDYRPWIVCPSLEGRIDEDDPLGAICAERRPRFAKKIMADLSIESSDPFGRIWRKSARKIVAHSDAWSYERNYDEGVSMGVRLKCSGQFLRDLLTKREADLLVLVRLQRYEKGVGSENSKFFNTVAVVRIKSTLDFEFYKGVINHTEEVKY